MMPNPPSVTRSVIAGLLLAALSAGSLIAFSLIAGSSNDPSGATVAARRPAVDAPAVVLGTRITRNDNSVAAEPPRQAQIDLRPGPSRADDAAVLGTRFRNDGRQRREQDRKAGAEQDAERAKTPARTSSVCHCKKRPDNTPNGHAYGYYKGPANQGGGGVARGRVRGSRDSSGPPASPPGKARGHSKKP